MKIPIVWRYMARQFLKVFLLSCSSFILLLLVTRLKEIARFISLTPHISFVGHFILNIIPLILPIAIPIACLIASMILFQGLSRTHELTALRCSGYSLMSMIFPILMISTALSLANFFIVSELTTTSQIQSHALIDQMVTQNPFHLLEQKNRVQRKNFYASMDVSERGKSAKNFLMISMNHKTQALYLMDIESLSIKENILFAPLTNLVSLQPKASGTDVLIEHEHLVSIPTQDLAKMLHHTYLRILPDHMPMSFLKIRLQQAKRSSDSLLNKNQKKSNEYRSEIIRRISIGLAVLSFTFLGIGYSIEIGRNSQRKNIMMISFLAIFALLSFFIGKIFHPYFYWACLAYLAPHAIIIAMSSHNLSKAMRGIE